MPQKAPRPAASDASEPNRKPDERVFLICGNDEFRVSTVAKKTADHLCPEAEQALGLEMIEGRVNTVGDAEAAVRQCLDALRTVGFFGGQRVVWLRDANFFADSVPSKSEDVKALVKELTSEIKSGLSEGQYLVISTEKVDGRSAFWKACGEHAAVREYQRSSKGWEADREAAAWAKQRFDRLGLRIGHDVLEAFLQKTGTESRQIVQEAEKLAVYLGDRKDVTLADIQEVTSTSRERLAWDLSDAFGNKDLPDALKVLRQLLFQRESHMRLIIGLENRVRELLVLRQALDQGWMRVSGGDRNPRVSWESSPDMDDIFSAFSSDPRRMHPFRAGRLAAQASNFRTQELVRCHADVLATHERLVTSGLQPGQLIEFLLIRLLSPARKEPSNMR